jgi:hypothetical protein
VSVPTSSSSTNANKFIATDVGALTTSSFSSSSPLTNQSGEVLLFSDTNQLVMDTNGDGVLNANDYRVNLNNVTTSVFSSIAYNVTANSEATANTITGGGLADTLAGGTQNDVITGGAGNDRLSGGTGNDQYRMSAPASNGSDTITDFTSGTDVIGLLSGGGGWNAAATAPASGALTTLDTADYIQGTVAAETALVAATHDNKVVEITASRTTTEISTGLSGAATGAIYVLVHNSTTGRGELWFDTNWSDTANRVQVATLDDITTLIGVTNLTFTNFGEVGAP